MLRQHKDAGEIGGYFYAFRAASGDQVHAADDHSPKRSSRLENRFVYLVTRYHLESVHFGRCIAAG